MSYAKFKGFVKKMNVKAGGKIEVVIEVKKEELDGQLELMAQTVDNMASVELESSVISYKVEVDAATKEPLLRYKVSESGIVAEVNASDQLELEGMPPKKIQTEEKEEMVSRDVVDDFILSGLAPDYDGYHVKLVEILQRHIKGESYLKLATEFNLSSHVIVEQANKYRMEIAPLAKGYADYLKEQEDGNT